MKRKYLISIICALIMASIFAGCQKDHGQPDNIAENSLDFDIIYNDASLPINDEQYHRVTYGMNQQQVMEQIGQEPYKKGQEKGHINYIEYKGGKTGDIYIFDLSPGDDGIYRVSGRFKMEKGQVVQE